MSRTKFGDNVEYSAKESRDIDARRWYGVDVWIPTCIRSLPNQYLKIGIRLRRPLPSPRMNPSSTLGYTWSMMVAVAVAVAVVAVAW